MKEYTLLLVDDEADNLDLLERFFRSQFHVLRALGGEHGLELLHQNEVHLMITDYKMPGMDGVTFMEQARKISPQAVRIMLTGYSNPLEIMAAINRGEAYRYLTKPCMGPELTLAIRQAVAFYKERGEPMKKLSELTKANAQLQDSLVQVANLVPTDLATGLYNQQFFSQICQREEKRAERFHQRLVLLLLHITNLDATCAAIGVKTDVLASFLAGIFSKNLRAVDWLGRSKDDEFSILLPMATRKDGEMVAERLCRAAFTADLSQISSNESHPRLNVVAGFATFPEDKDAGASLQEIAQTALLAVESA